MADRRTRAPKLRAPRHARVYVLAHPESGMADFHNVYFDAEKAQDDGDKTERVAVYKFAGYRRGRGRREPIPW